MQWTRLCQEGAVSNAQGARSLITPPRRRCKSARRATGGSDGTRLAIWRAIGEGIDASSGLQPADPREWAGRRLTEVEGKAHAAVTGENVDRGRSTPRFSRATSSRTSGVALPALGATRPLAQGPRASLPWLVSRAARSGDRPTVLATSIAPSRSTSWHTTFLTSCPSRCWVSSTTFAPS